MDRRRLGPRRAVVRSRTDGRPRGVGPDDFPLPDHASEIVSRVVRVVRYATDGRTPVIVECVTTDIDGTVWIVQRDLETGDLHFHHIPGDRA